MYLNVSLNVRLALAFFIRLMQFCLCCSYNSLFSLSKEVILLYLAIQLATINMHKTLRLFPNLNSKQSYEISTFFDGSVSSVYEIELNYIWKMDCLADEELTFRHSLSSDLVVEFGFNQVEFIDLFYQVIQKTVSELLLVEYSILFDMELIFQQALFNGLLFGLFLL